MQFKYNEKYIQLNKDKYDINKYVVITFLLDRPDKKEIIVEQNYSLCRVLRVIAYNDLNTIYCIDDGIEKINEDIKHLKEKKNMILPDKKYIFKYNQLKFEIDVMKDKLQHGKYLSASIPLINKSIKEKEKAIKRLQKHTYKLLSYYNLDLDSITPQYYILKENADDLINELELFKTVIKENIIGVG